MSVSLLTRLEFLNFIMDVVHSIDDDDLPSDDEEYFPEDDSHTPCFDNFPPLSYSVPSSNSSSSSFHVPKSRTKR